jgi:hypothetical protein
MCQRFLLVLSKNQSKNIIYHYFILERLISSPHVLQQGGFPQHMRHLAGRVELLIKLGTVVLFKICPSEKNSVFQGALSIFPFLFESNRIKRNKKYPSPQTISSTYKKNFSQIGHSISEKRGRKVGSFLTFRIPICHRRKHYRNSSLAQLLIYYPRSICPESFKFF